MRDPGLLITYHDGLPLVTAQVDKQRIKEKKGSRSGHRAPHEMRRVAPTRYINAMTMET
jgi:hypothetical protein